MPDERFVQPEADTRPWHQRSPYAGVKTDPHERVIHGRRTTQGVNFTFTREAVEEIRQGRRCGECHEPQLLGDWPKRCAVCQADFKFAYDRWEKRFQGEEWVGTTINWRDEMDRLDDELERDNWAADAKTSILLPPGVKL